MANATSVFVLDNITVRQQGDLFSLGDLHTASGGEEKHKSSNFLRLDTTQALIAEMAKGSDVSLFLQVVKGRNGGTYACRELVIAYAAWIDAPFHLKVLRVFLATTAPQAGPAIAYDRISPAQTQDLKEIVAAIVAAKVQTYGETWARLQKKFRVNSYLELPATQHLQARAYLLDKLPKGDADGVIQQAPAPTPTIDPLNAQAMAAASKQAQEYFDAARQGKYLQQPTAFPPEVLCGLLARAMMDQRFMLSFDRCAGRMNVTPVPQDAYVLSWSQFARGVVTNDIDPSNTELAELAAACNQRLARRLAA